MGRKKGSKNQVAWPAVIEETKSIIADFTVEDLKPSIRAVFYRLVSSGTLPNTKGYAGSLSHHLVDARKDNIIPFSAFIDGTRYNIDNFSDTRLQSENLKYAESGCKQKLSSLSLDEVVSNYFNYEYMHLKAPLDGFWAEQPIIPEIWLEKDTLAAIVEKLTTKLHVAVRVNRGFDSWTHLYTSIYKLKEVLETHEKACILYVGDLDPSGKDMDEHMRDALNVFDVADRVEFRRIALTEDQVERYDLPKMPTDEATLEKIANDPRTANYKSKYITEVDAFLAMAPKAFKQLIQSTVLGFHNNNIAEGVAERNQDIVDQCRAMRLNAIEEAKMLLLNQIKKEEK
jgi:hypothetical protein